MSKIMNYLQKIGKSLMLPVAVLPMCAILMGIGYLLCPGSMQGAEITGVAAKIGYYMVAAGGAMINNMAILFAIGVSMGMSDDNHGASCLSGIVSWLMITTLLSSDTLSTLFPSRVSTDTQLIAFQKIQNPFVGILCGIIGAESYNRCKKVVLPNALAFFSGKRFVAIVTIAVSIVVAAILMFVWPALFTALAWFGQKIVSLKGYGVGIYTFFNRLLIPSGLHHALNNVFWFDTIGIGDLTNFWAGKTSEDVSWSLGMYMSGFFPCMIGGVPGAILAMYHTSKNKKKAKGILLSSALSSIICGVTEPFEFSFMFGCFPLYIVYSFLCAVISFITYLVGFRAGFAFSGGATDLLFSSSLPAAQRTWLIIPLVLFAFALFYWVFRFLIVKFDIKTPGREGEDCDGASLISTESTANMKGSPLAERIVACMGGKNNIVRVDCCATRLRFDLVNAELIDRDGIKSAGTLGIKVLGKTSAQVIIGTQVQQVCDGITAVLASPGCAAPSFPKAAADASVTSGEPSQKTVVASGKHLTVCHGQRIRLGESSFAFEYIIRDPLGIHARPAGAIVKSVKKYNATVRVFANGKSANATSLTELMALGAVQNTVLTVSADGPEALDAIATLKEYMHTNL